MQCIVIQCSGQDFDVVDQIVVVLYFKVFILMWYGICDYIIFLVQVEVFYVVWFDFVEFYCVEDVKYICIWNISLKEYDGQLEWFVVWVLGRESCE